jgi:hypothetical protein
MSLRLSRSMIPTSALRGTLAGVEDTDEQRFQRHHVRCYYLLHLLQADMVKRRSTILLPRKHCLAYHHNSTTSAKLSHYFSYTSTSLGYPFTCFISTSTINIVGFSCVPLLLCLLFFSCIQRAIRSEAKVGVIAVMITIMKMEMRQDTGLELMCLQIVSFVNNCI